MYTHDWGYGDHTTTITLHVWHVLILVLLLVANPRRYQQFGCDLAYVVLHGIETRVLPARVGMPRKLSHSFFASSRAPTLDTKVRYKASCV